MTHVDLLQPALRALSHEELSRIAAQMAVALERITKGVCSEEWPAQVAEAALRNTFVVALQELAD